MISQRLTEKINDQIRMEFQSASYYMGMRMYLSRKDWPGMAQFMEAQALEEATHAKKFYDFLDEVDQDATMRGLDEPKEDFSSLEDVFETALQQEQSVTESIHELYEIAQEEGDYQAFTLLEWFVDEQIEEENTFRTILTKIRRLQDEPLALYELDEELGQRSLQEADENDE